MAKKNRETPVNPVESEEEAFFEEESEPEPTKKPPMSTPSVKKSSPSKPAKTPAAPSSSSSSEEFESESESDSDSDDAPKEQPHVEKPKDVAKKWRSPTKANTNTSNDIVLSPVKSTTGNKREAVEESKETETKEAKKSKKGEVEKAKGPERERNLFERLWSDGDEIEILQGMIDYAESKKVDPSSEWGAFHEFIKKNLQVVVSRSQLRDKIRRLKKKFLNNITKEKGGKDLTFTNPHEQRAYDLSKKIWGIIETSVKENVSSKASGGTTNKGGSSIVATSMLDYYDGVMTIEGRIERLGVELFEMRKCVEREKLWKKPKKEEMEAHLKQL